METIWTVLGDKRFFSKRPILDAPVYREKLSVNDFYSWELIELSAIYPNAKIINNPDTYSEKIFCAGGMFFRSHDKEKWERSLSRVKFEEVWNPQELKKGRRWVLRHECKDQPFSGINLAMAVISTQTACEGLGLCPPSKSYSQLVSEYHRGYK